MGEWLCHSCQFNAERKKPSTSTSKSVSSPRTRSKRSLSTSDITNNKPSKKSKLSPFDVLVEAAQALNPKQFELPYNMSVPFCFPGSDRGNPLIIFQNDQLSKNFNVLVEKLFVNSNKRNSKIVRKPTVTIQGSTLPLTNGKCFECRKSCRVAPLITCDYCPILYHLDCLDPPLSTPPAGRWMCPNHVEHFLVSIKSI